MADFETERQEYKKKVQKQKEAIANLLTLAQQHSTLFDHNILRQLENYHSKCEKLYRKLDKNEFEIAIVGLEKAGKSTFGNALMENRILPDADERCTYTSTCIRYGQNRAVVKFFNNHEMDEVLRGYLKTLGVENVEAYTYQSLSKSEYLAIFSKLDERDKSRYENTVHQDILNLLENKNEILANYVGQPDKIFQNDELYTENFKAYIVSPRVAVAVKEVSIESSQLGNLQNAVIYDVPGFDSPTSMHLEQTKARMKEADAIMLIASAEKPSFTAPALNMFQEVVDEDNVSLGDKLFIFGNRADAANTLSKNIQTLKNEALKWKLLSHAQLEERMIIGSAKAHLQAKGLVDGDYCVRKINEDKEYQNAWSHGDGIDYAYQKLVEYNQTERFQVMKRKIRRNNEDLLEIFKGLKEKYSNNTYGIDLCAWNTALSNLKTEAKSRIVRNLEELRHEIRSKYNQDALLSKRLKEVVLQLFEEDDGYNITDENIHDAELKIIEVNGSTNVEKVEELIREKKFKKIYDDFSQVAFSVANNDHAEYYARIIDCFESALNVVKGSSYYEKLHGYITTFVERCKKNTEDEFIYQSLIERFVRDLVEVLIGRPYTSEARLNKFIDTAEIFSGLVLFYNSDDTNDGYKRQFLAVAPKNQPLILALVFHDYKQSDESSKSVMHYLGEIFKPLCENPEVIQLAFSIVKLDPFGGAEAVMKLIDKNSFKNCKSEEDYLRNIIPSLRSLRESITKDNLKYDFDFTNPEIFKKQYKKFFGNTPVRNYENVKEFFSVDLEILKKFLVHASIPAICLEKPFVAREVQAITKLLELVQSAQFDEMIDGHSQEFLPGDYDVFNTQIANIAANQAAVAEVEKILKTIDNNL